MSAAVVLLVLRRVRQRLSSARAWTKRAPARDGNGNAVAPRSHHAASWSVSGAIEAEMGRLPHREAMGLVLDAYQPGCPNLAAWEDAPTTTHADVLRVLDRAIAAAASAEEASS